MSQRLVGSARLGNGHCRTVALNTSRLLLILFIHLWSSIGAAESKFRDITS